MKNKSAEILLSLNGSNVLKAIAILAVFVIHILSSIRISPFVIGSTFQLIAVTLDQLSRISVPLFVALSGYGLHWKYSKKISIGSFYFKRASKVLPLYFFWSTLFALLFYLVPAWGPATQQPGFVWQLFLGRADYHLYFVPMIFQIYIIFPLLLVFFKKWPLQTLLSAIAAQLIWWWFFSYQDNTITTWKYFAGDGEQYIWMTNWIAYFVLGMYLPKIWFWINKNKLRYISIFGVWIASAFYTILSAVKSIQAGVDPLLALKFTRYPMFIYSFFAIIFLSFIVAKFHHSKKSNSLLIYLGKNSYPIYLGHTFLLRIVVFFLFP
ncbi:MAG: hypothetical protein COZ34_02990 [Candidatus Pacebacteria bacterium CG_4_10_14_3_um_filter_34_15]|nr:MAG: hypothetical protein COZ34_02990 [Candidatus Pacebacteria bacterium CG_4_10_14_3_um_filter_34_15]